MSDGVIIFPGSGKGSDETKDEEGKSRILVMNFLSLRDLLHNEKWTITFKPVTHPEVLRICRGVDGVSLMYRPDQEVLGMLISKQVAFSGGSVGDPAALQGIHDEHWQMISEDVTHTTGLTDVRAMADMDSLSMKKGETAIYIQYSVSVGPVGPKILKTCWSLTRDA